ncbi:MAG: FAD/NAD(P)-binding protein [Pseudomonadota bacterium]
MSRPVLAIIGAGFSGATLAAQLLGEARRAPKIIMIDRSGRFGPGLAYATHHSAHLLNVPADKLGLTPDRPGDFTDFVRFCSRDPDPSGSFAQRTIYGSFLETQMRRLARASGPGELTLLRDAVVSCRTTPGAICLELSSGASIKADAAVLALGNLPTRAPTPFDTLPLEESRALRDPWDQGALSRIQPHDDILILGSGLTMIDAVLSLSAAPRRGIIYVLSRHGLTPRSHGEDQASPGAPVSYDAPLSAMLHAFRREIVRAGNWRQVIDRLRPETTAMWRKFSPERQQRFLRHLRPWWDVHRHRTPAYIHAWFQALQQAGMVRVLAGRVVHAAPTPSGFHVAYLPRGLREARTLDVAQIINCTGACADLAAARDPLIQDMLRSGIARSHASGLGFDIEEDGRLIDGRGQPQQRLFALGPLTQGAFWEATSVPEIRMRASQMRSTLLAAMPGHGAVRSAPV